MRSRQHFNHRQPGDVGDRVMEELQGRRPAPRAFQVHIEQVIADELQDPRASVDMRDDLQDEIGLVQRPQDRLGG